MSEQRALVEGEAGARAVVDLSDRDVVTVTGPDRLTWLDSLLSQSLAKLAPGESAEALLLDPSGRIEYVARVVDDGETTWLLIDAGTGAGLAAFLDRMRFMLRVEVADVSTGFATVGTLGEPVGGVVTWRDPWAHVVAGGHQYATVTEHPGTSWTYSETLVPRDRLDSLDRGAARHPGPRSSAHCGLASAGRDRTRRHGDPARVRLDPLGGAPREGLLPRAGDGREGAQSGASAAPARDAAPRRFRGRRVAAGDEVLLGDKSRRAGSSRRGPPLRARADRARARSAQHRPHGDAHRDARQNGVVAAAQEVIVPTDAGAEADVPRLPRLGAVKRP